MGWHNICRFLCVFYFINQSFTIMKNLIFFSVLSLFSFGLLQAQHGSPSDPSYVTTELVTTWPSELLNPSAPSIILVGSPYAEDGYKTGNAIIDGKVDFTAPMRYNSAKGVIEFLADGKVEKEMLRRPYLKANVGGKIYEILEFLEGNEIKKGYFNALSFGKTKLVFKPEKKVIIEKWAGNNQEKRAYYKDISKYFIKLDGKPAKEVKLNKKSILDSFEIKNRKLLEFAIEKQQLNLTKQSDVIRLLDYYDALKRNSSEVKEMQS